MHKKQCVDMCYLFPRHFPQKISWDSEPKLELNNNIPVLLGVSAKFGRAGAEAIEYHPHRGSISRGNTHPKMPKLTRATENELSRQRTRHVKSLVDVELHRWRTWQGGGSFCGVRYLWDSLCVKSVICQIRYLSLFVICEVPYQRLFSPFF